ncbi:MAG: SHOCT domain-containing protein [Bacteroidales bacterium]|nr:SHOCT domain-containing protein [Bacteroidales bacterium]
MNTKTLVEINKTINISNMKNVYLLLVAVSLFLQAHSQKLKREEMMLQIDSLNKVNQNLSVTLDSVNNEKELYFGMYEVVKEKVVKNDFNPAEMANIIDSLKINTNSNTSSLIESNTSLKDSLYLMIINLNQLQLEFDNLKDSIEQNEIIHTQEDVIKAIAIGNLKQLKELFDSGILNDEEFLILKKKYVKKL